MMSLYAHREEILQLPEHVARGNVNAVQHFIDVTLVEIDADLAQQIRYDKNVGIGIELVRDHTAALTYISYIQLILNAIPPNFYIYHAAKWGIYIVLEILLTLVLAFFTAGAGVAARLTAISARLAAAGSKGVKIGKGIHHAQQALASLTRTLDDFALVAQKLESLGEVLQVSRVNKKVLNGRSNTTLQDKKEEIKRNKVCRNCRSEEHGTPERINRLGQVNYE
jgi:hypothetical protein